MPRFAVLAVGILMGAAALAAEEASPTAQGDALVTEYFRRETEALTAASLAEVKSADDWTARRGEYRRQLLDMLGLDPMRKRTPLNAVTTGTIDQPEFTVENVHFQSSPGLYVTGNLYVPKGLAAKAPAVLYVCGHSQVKKDGVSYGNKTAYQHHGIWFAKNGYVCLVIDSLQLGEIEGIHHGLYREKMWWWIARGYSPAGVEAWNCIRALDYLQSRPEVDGTRLGVTGRSGGGAYSWWLAAIDDRIQAAVPVAGITSLHNHVVDGCIEGHCDCMYQFNTYRWDYPQVAALVAPRALLISNTDKDTIFPLEGVVDVHAGTRRIYQLLGAPEKLGLHITEGGHNDTQELQVHAFVWMNRFLKDDKGPIDDRTEKRFEPEQLRVFGELPGDSINARVQDVFVPLADPTIPPDDRLSSYAEERIALLKDKVFRGWPAVTESLADLDIREVRRQRVGPYERTDYEFTSQAPYRLPLIVVQSASARDAATRRPLRIRVLDQAGWESISAALAQAFPPGGEELADVQAELQTLGLNSEFDIAFVAPRGVGPTEWSREEKKRTQIRRRFALLGQSDDGMRVFDVAQAVRAARAVTGVDQESVTLEGQNAASVWALYAAILGPRIGAVSLDHLPASHSEGPDLCNILRVLDVPQAKAIAGTRTKVIVTP